MTLLDRNELKPGMVVAEDVLVNGTAIVKKDEELTIESISNLLFFEVPPVAIVSAEVPKVTLTSYQKFRKDYSFKKFQQIYDSSLVKYKDAMTYFLNTGHKMDSSMLIKMVFDITSVLPTSYSLINYLYYMMPNEHELTYTHSLSSACLANAIAEWMNLSQAERRTLILCAFYFDIGKLRLPYELLWKTGQLTHEDIKMLKSHPLIGYQIVRNLEIDTSIKNAVLMHHERVDGSGYPYGFNDSNIDTYAKYMAIIDSYIALASPRAYREAYPPLKIISILESSMSKYDFKILAPILHKIAQSQIGHEVTLNNGTIWEISAINMAHLSRPLLINDLGEMLNLSTSPEFEIVKML